MERASGIGYEEYSGLIDCLLYSAAGRVPRSTQLNKVHTLPRKNRAARNLIRRSACRHLNHLHIPDDTDSHHTNELLIDCTRKEIGNLDIVNSSPQAIRVQ